MLLEHDKRKRLPPCAAAFLVIRCLSETSERENVRVFNISNIKKTVYYLKRNGIRKTFAAAAERVTGKETYCYKPPTEAEEQQQREHSFTKRCKFSILVPAYETKEGYLRQLIETMLSQTYSDFELIIADASEGKCVEETVRSYTDERILYKRLSSNRGISENTNEALQEASGEYIGLLDHDDFLTPDALYEMAHAIEKKKKTGEEPEMLYSDEDKCDSTAAVFYEPNIKPDFNLDLLLSNNYICHFLVLKAELLKTLKFRKEFDGAQDYDLVLRASAMLLNTYGFAKTGREKICHIPKCLYHWRCHEGSTAQNPKSKQYAYEAGRRAVESFLKQMGWNAVVEHSEHVGFYNVISPNPFLSIGEVAAIGGKVLNRKNRICAGVYDSTGKILYQGLPVYFSGPMNRAAMNQTAYALDLRCIKINPSYKEIFERITGLVYRENKSNGCFLWQEYTKDSREWKLLSLRFAEEVAGTEGRLLFLPSLTEKIK